MDAINLFESLVETDDPMKYKGYCREILLKMKTNEINDGDFMHVVRQIKYCKACLALPNFSGILFFFSSSPFGKKKIFTSNP